MTDHILKRHNKNLLLYHIVCPVKYRREVFTAVVEQALKETCIGISERYEINFVEIGADENHLHFLVQSVPVQSPTEIVTAIKSITAKELFSKHPEVKDKLWGGHFWTSGYYINTVGATGNEQVIRAYVKKQGLNYSHIYRGQLSLFE
ncbi:IS200/IS605 family transposase [Gemmatimonadota bacterium]